MSTVISLKKLRESSTLKDQISKLEKEKEELQRQLDLQKKLEAKLREDIISHKKDFEHLEKQFDHFAGLEADHEALQTEIQMERLENLLNQEKEESKARNLVKKAKEELKQVQDELRELKKLDPQRLKRQVVDLKKKNATQAAENKTLNNALVAARKELKETQAEKEKLTAELEAARGATDFFWQSKDGEWALYETCLRLKDEASEESPLTRVKCLNTLTGVSVVSKELGEDGLAVWHGGQDIPEEVSKEAGNRLKKIAAEAQEESGD